MFHYGKPKLVTTMAALLGMCLSGAGCQAPFMAGMPGKPAASATPAPAGAAVAANNANNAAAQSSNNNAPAQDQGNTAAAQSSPPGTETTLHSDEGYLPKVVQKTNYQTASTQPNTAPAGVPGQLGLAPTNCGNAGGGPGPIPREIDKVSLPTYTVAPPDVLMIDAGQLVPKPPYRVEPLEVLTIQVTDTLPDQPINGAFTISPEGSINLGYGYGIARVQGLTVDQIQGAIRQHLSNILHNPQVSVALAQFRGQQQIRGEHLVRPDGTISLGIYGSVYVAGMTLDQIKAVIENQLQNFVINPQVAVDVCGYNSQWYYVVFDGGCCGEKIFRLPITGNETVLDAISNLHGLPPVSSRWRVWVARPAPCGHPCDQILMVDWEAVVKGGSTCTNYQLFPGDRVYVGAECLAKRCCCQDCWCRLKALCMWPCCGCLR
jgi:polysaccharide biosynthesis/export protein